MCTASVTEAFFWMRRQAPGLRQELLGTLVDVTLSATPGDVRAKGGLELVDLPFDQQEEAWFEEHLTTRQGKARNADGDALMARWMAQGNWTAVLERGKALDPSWELKDGVNWESLVEGVTRGVGESKGLEDWRIG
jgi:hypothetical protein